MIIAPQRREIVLRPYQEQLIVDIRMALRKHRRVLVRLPTGGGKTILAAKMFQTASERGFDAFFNCHRDFLIDQTKKTFDRVGIQHGFVASGYPWQPHRLVQICSIDTLKNRLDRVKKPKLFAWDEAQHIAAAGWAKVQRWADEAKHIGLSATPCRKDGKCLSDFFDEMVMGPTEAWLIENGFLSPYMAYAPTTLDVSGIHSRGGDFAIGELETAADKNKIIGDLITHYRKYAMDKRAIGFAVSIKHSEHCAAMFREAGIMALHIDGTTPRDERRDAARAFAEGHIKVLWNCGLMGEGYDLSAQAEMDVTIDCLIDAAPTQSLAWHRQKIGRAMRPKSDGSAAILLDHAGNLARHGFPDDEIEWTLAGKIKKRGSGQGGIPTRQCPMCFHVHRPAPSCPDCGYVYPSGGGAREVREEEGELQQVKRQQRFDKKAQEWSAQTLDELIEIGEKRGYQYPAQWAARIWTIHEARKREQTRTKENSQFQMFNDPL